MISKKSIQPQLHTHKLFKVTKIKRNPTGILPKKGEKIICYGDNGKIVVEIYEPAINPDPNRPYPNPYKLYGHIDLGSEKLNFSIFREWEPAPTKKFPDSLPNGLKEGDLAELDSFPPSLRILVKITKIEKKPEKYKVYYEHYPPQKSNSYLLNDCGSRFRPVTSSTLEKLKNRINILQSQINYLTETQ